MILRQVIYNFAMNIPFEKVSIAAPSNTQHPGRTIVTQ